MAVVMISAENKSYVDGSSGDKFFELSSDDYRILCRRSPGSTKWDF